MRDLRKTVAEYKKKFLGSNSTKGQFFTSDYYQIKEMSQSPDGHTILFDVITNALEAGFMIGYRLGKKEVIPPPNK